MSLRTKLAPLNFMLEMMGRLVKPHPLRSREKSYDTPPFFIVSSGRSGTTLLRALLNQDPTVHIPPEFKIIRNLYHQYQRLNKFLPWHFTVRMFGATVAASKSLIWWEMPLEDFYAGANALPPSRRSLASLIHTFYSFHARQVKPTATRWGDKSPVNISRLKEIEALFPDAKIIHIMRDGRDVVASIHELGWHDSLEITCNAWLNNLQAVLDYPNRDDKEKFLELRYESLVADPEGTMIQVCEFLGLDFGPEMFEYFQHPESLGTEARQAHHSGLKRPINGDSIGSWRQRLDTAEQTYVSQRLGPMLTRLGYETDKI